MQSDKQPDGEGRPKSLWDMINELKRRNDLSSAEIRNAIHALVAEHEDALIKAIEMREQERERKREERRERARKEREERAAAEKEARRIERERRREEERKRKEHVREVTSMELPLDFENAFNSDQRLEGVRCDSPADGLILSLTTLGRVDIEYISAVCGCDMPTVIRALEGAIYQNPETWEECFYKGWETADEYLTGNLMHKWSVASKQNAAYDGWFARNLDAISRVMPAPVAPEDIFVTIGSPWVPPDVIDDFILHILGPTRHASSGDKTVFEERTGTWEIPNKGRYYDHVRSYSTYGTSKIQALYILEKTLNLKSVAVYDEIACRTNKSGVKRVINKAETTAALEKQAKMIDAFRKWIWRDEERTKRLQEIFVSKFGCYRKRRYDGSFLTFPNMDASVSLYPYQRDAVARILFAPNTLLAHDVGSGKTYVMIAAGMELRRMGLAAKCLYVVPNNIVGQWERIFRTLYPQARLLVVDANRFAPSKRLDVMESIRDDDYDGIVMAQSVFDMIPLSLKFYEDELTERKHLLDELDRKRKGGLTAGQRRERQKISEQIVKLASEYIKAANMLCFDELGIDRLFVDEAHHYKNVPIATKIDRVLGISSKGSKKCKDMLDKVRVVQRANGGGGVVMATGTPITNSITDVYVFQQYLQSGELALLDLNSFDSWVGMFAERATEFEIDVDTNAYRLATRFSRFHNLPELTTLLSSVSDFHRAINEQCLPQFDGYKDALVGKTTGLREYLKSISIRADAVRRGLVRRDEDNMLKITGDGRKAALDLRLVDPAQAFTMKSKVGRCAENVVAIYQATARERSAQIVFCDTSTPKESFNVYDELKRLLVLGGVREEEIAFVHHANTDRARNALFAATRQGKIRVLMGSTFKLGTGVNVQDKLIALHHLDVPWRPADMVQREGRIIRPGNTNERIDIYRYITEGSFDAYSWQLLETKQRFISALLSGSWEERSGSDIDNTVLSYAEVKALAVGNPLIKERVETANELLRLTTLQHKLVENREILQREYISLPPRIEALTHGIAEIKADLAFVQVEEYSMTREDRIALRRRLFEALCDNELQESERESEMYRGFTVILPARMLKQKPFVYLRRVGTYYVEMGDTEKGNLTRMDNCIDGLQERLAREEERRDELMRQRARILEELSKDETYAEQIEATKAHLEAIDKKLKVNV